MFRTCRFEEVEPRRMMSAAPPQLQFGAVYHEVGMQAAQGPQEMAIAFTGGAAGTELTTITIDLSNGGTKNNIFFNTAPGGPGYDTAYAPAIVSMAGIASATIDPVSDGGTLLTIHATGFNASEVLKISFRTNQTNPLSASVDGNEFSNTLIVGQFTHAVYPYAAVTASDHFEDYYNYKLLPSGLASAPTSLPLDIYMPPASQDEHLLTAGAVGSAQQAALCSISGVVFHDPNTDNAQQPGETGLGNWTVSLFRWNGSSYVATGLTTLTDANGNYKFDNMAPGLYQVRETQEAGYLSVGATGGTVSGPTPAVVDNPNNISQINLTTGFDSVHNDFAEVRPASVSGRVFYDLNNNGLIEAGEPGIANAGLTLYQLVGGTYVATTLTTQTDAVGNYAFNNLMPGTYQVREAQPAGYTDGIDTAGTVDRLVGGVLTSVVVGAADSPDADRISGIALAETEAGVHYNFGEINPARISGNVYYDKNKSGQYDPGDELLPNVTVNLYDGGGNLVATTVTDAAGYYQFTGLVPDVYAVVEDQPSGYLQGQDHVGSLGGDNPAVNMLASIQIQAGANGVHYDFGEITTTPPITPPYVPPPTPPEPLRIPPPPQAPPGEPIVYIREYPIQDTSPPLLFLGGGAVPAGVTWHLSVVNAGQPRHTQDGKTLADGSGQSPFQFVGKTDPAEMQESSFVLFDADGKPIKRYVFGKKRAMPVSGDWNGDGTRKVGVFLAGEWFLDLNGDGKWNEGDLWARLGADADRPVTGDWDADGKTDIGIFGPEWAGDGRAIAAEPGEPDPQNTHVAQRAKNMPPKPEEAAIGWRAMRRDLPNAKTRADVIDHVFRYGSPSDVPLAGDWNGDGTTTIGVFRNGTWYLDVNGDGRFGSADQQVQFGQQGDLPVVGDWSGDGISKIGVFRNGTFILDSNNNRQMDQGDQRLEVGGPNDRPVVGDWTGDGVDKVGVYRDGQAEAPPVQASVPNDGVTR